MGLIHRVGPQMFGGFFFAGSVDCNGSVELSASAISLVPHFCSRMVRKILRISSIKDQYHNYKL